MAAPPTRLETNAVVAICVVLVPGAAVGAVGVPVNEGESIVARNKISAMLAVIEAVFAAMAVVLLVMLAVFAAMAFVLLVIEAVLAAIAIVLLVMLAVFAAIAFVLLVIEAVLAAILVVLLVMLAVFEAIKVGNVAIVEELTPPTLFTVGNAADPPRSFVN